MTRFRYRAERSSLGRILRPIATVFVSYAGDRVELPMYIDSGADISMIPFRFGKALGLQQAPADTVRELSGISGGAVPYVIKQLDLRIGRTSYFGKRARLNREHNFGGGGGPSPTGPYLRFQNLRRRLTPLRWAAAGGQPWPARCKGSIG